MTRTITLFTIFLTLIGKIIALSLPAVTGKYDVGTVQFPLTDYSRSDPSAPSPGTPRSIMVQLFYPGRDTNRYSLAPYITPVMAQYIDAALGAPNGTINQIKTHSHQGAPIIQTSAIPTVFFSHGLGTYRALYTTLVEDLASHGYLVVSIDHPYDASIVEFPNGNLIFLDPAVGNASTAQLDALIDVRVKDVLFTLSTLQQRLPTLLPGAHNHLRVKNPGTFGHSFGGAAAANVMLADSCFVGGINMDGTVYGPAPARGLDRPFMFMGVPDHNLSSDTTWSMLWSNLRGWKRAIVLEGAEHRSYSDVGVIASLLNATMPVDAELGTIDALRANMLQRRYIRAFFDFVLKGKGDEIFGGVNEEYPEVLFED